MMLRGLRPAFSIAVPGRRNPANPEAMNTGW
jgi:hypothetical protein